jgi:hypothetical protein
MFFLCQGSGVHRAFARMIDLFAQLNASGFGMSWVFGVYWVLGLPHLGLGPMESAPPHLGLLR